jgi:hypothetical protein
VFAAVGVGHYLPYAAVAIAVHAVVVLLAWLLLLREGVRPWIATGLGSVLAVMGVGVENTLWAFQIGFTGALALGLLALLVMPRAAGQPARDLLVPTLLLCALMCSGQGLVVLVVLTTYALLVRGWRYAGLVGAFGVLAYGTWYAAIGHRGPHSAHLTADRLAGLPRFAVAGLTHSWDGLTGISGGGAVVLGGAVVVLGWLVVRRELHALALSCLAGAVMLFLLTGLSRDQSEAQASVSRYAYLAACLTAPAVAVAVQQLIGRQPVRHRAVQALAVLAVGGMLLTGVQDVERFAGHRAAVIGRTQEQLIGSVALARSGQELLDQSETPYRTRQEALAPLVRATEHGKGLRGPVTDQGLLDAAAVLQVRVSTRPTGWAGPAVSPVTLGMALADEGSCRTGRSVRPAAILDLPTQGQVELRFSTSAPKVLTRVLRDGRFSATETWSITSAGPQYLASTVPAGAHLQLVIEHPASFALCVQGV